MELQSDIELNEKFNNVSLLEVHKKFLRRNKHSCGLTIFILFLKI